MYGRYLWLLVFVSWLTFCAGQGSPGGAPEEEYVINFESPIYVCDDPLSKAFVDPSGIEVDRFNETAAVLEGSILFRVKVDKGTAVVIKIEKNNQGRMDEVVSMDICDFCGELMDVDSQLQKYFKAFGFPQECPFDAGEYHIEKFLAEFSDVNCNSSNQGKYRATVTISADPDGSCKNLEFLACIAFDYVIEKA